MLPTKGPRAAAAPTSRGIRCANFTKMPNRPVVFDHADHREGNSPAKRGAHRGGGGRAAGAARLTASRDAKSK
jgi:hypothetical protein